MLHTRLGLLFVLICSACADIAAGAHPARPQEANPKPPREVDPRLFCPPPPDTSDPTPVPLAKARRDPDLIQKTVRSAFPDFRLCYEAALGRNRDATGRVQVRFDIDAAGHVVNECIQPPAFRDGAAVDCVLTRFRKLAFGDGKTVTVVYPIEFSTETASPTNATPP